MKNKFFLVIIFHILFFQFINAQGISRDTTCCYNIDTLIISGDSIACCEDSVQLCVESDSCLHYQWYYIEPGYSPVQVGTDDNCIYASQTGDYYVEGWNNCDTAQSANYYVQVISFVHYLSDLIATDTIVCYGDSTMLYVSDSLDCYGYIWIVGNDTLYNNNFPYYYAHDSTTYSVIVYNECDSANSAVTLGPIFVHVSHVYASIYNVHKLHCNPSHWEGSVNYGGGYANYTFYWSSGETTSTAYSLVLGYNYVTVTDANGCTATASVNITESRLAVVITCSKKTISTCRLTANPMGGVSPYTYYWSTGATSQTITANVGVSYTVTVTDNVGCTATNNGNCSSCDTKSIFESNSENNSESIFVYPNPANTTITVDLSNDISIKYLYIKIFDMSGKEVLNQTSINQNSIQINTEHLNNGLYIVEIKSDTELIRKQITIEK